MKIGDLISPVVKNPVFRPKWRSGVIVEIEQLVFTRVRQTSIRKVWILRDDGKLGWVWDNEIELSDDKFSDDATPSDLEPSDDDRCTEPSNQ